MYIADENLAPQVGLEPTTKRLTAARSTAELLRNVYTTYYIVLGEPPRTYPSVGGRLILLWKDPLYR